jgi:hypothetical protein
LYRSNDTFLFPVMQGTYRADVGVTSNGMTPTRFLRFFVKCWLEPMPIHTLGLFFACGLLVKETSARRPMAAQWLAAFGSLAMLSFAFSLSDPGNLARYTYGFMTASALYTWQTIASTFRPRAMRAWDLALAGVLFYAIFTPIQESVGDGSRLWMDLGLRDTAELFRRTIPPQAEPPIAQAYHHIQNAVPPGEPILVMVDRAYLFDFKRNPIVNLDTPGSASPAPGMPAFRGSEPVAKYLHGLGIRYVAYVDPEASMYLYRRVLWEDQVVDPDEIWRLFAPYAVDVIDNLEALSLTRKRVVEDGQMRLLDLETMESYPAATGGPAAHPSQGTATIAQ